MIKFVTAALLAVAIPTAAMADTLTGEIRFSDPRGDGRADATEYRVEGWKSVGGFNLGAELQTKQAENQGKLTSTISLKAGTTLPTVAGFNTVAYAELGESLSEKEYWPIGRTIVTTGGNKTFWGAAVKTSRPIAGGFSVTAGYRHREGFDSGDLKEDRLSGGLTYAVSKKSDLGVTYYRTRSGGNDTDAIGVGLTHKF